MARPVVPNPVPTTGTMVETVRDLAEWRRMAVATFVPLDVSGPPGRPFRGWVRAHRGADVLACEVAAESRHTVRRSRAIIGRRPSGMCKLSFQLAGRSVLTNPGGERVLRVGDFAIYDADVPYALENEAGFHSLVLMFPRRVLGLRDHELCQAAALPLTEGEGHGRLVGPVLRELAARPDHLVGPLGPRTVYSALELVACAVVEQLGVTPSASPAQRVAEWLEGHLRDTDLSLATIASAHFMSTRQLQSLFQREGTSVSTWVRQRRLERCREDLANPGLAGTSIASLSRHWGFADQAHFARCFRRAFGVSPSQFREERLEALAPARPGPAGALLNPV